jgi:RNA polymerase sigma-70 factor (ECF subfamily)
LQLLDRAVTGDEIAINRLLRAYHEPLLRELERRLPRDVRASLAPEDVAPEADVVVFRRIAEFDVAAVSRDESSRSDAFFAWLLRIAENRAMSMVRDLRADKRGGGRARVRPRDRDSSEVVNLLELLGSHSRTPSRSVAIREAADAVQTALDQLSPDHRDVLRLRYIEALPVADVAVRLQRSEGAVHQLCRRGLRALRDAIGDPDQYLTRKG